MYKYKHLKFMPHISSLKKQFIQQAPKWPASYQPRPPPGGGHSQLHSLTQSPSRDRWANKLVFLSRTSKLLETALLQWSWTVGGVSLRWDSFRKTGWWKCVVSIKRKSKHQQVPVLTIHTVNNSEKHSTEFQVTKLHPFHKYLTPWFCFLILQIPEGNDNVL